MSKSTVTTSISLDLFNPSQSQITRAKLTYAISLFDVLPLPALLIVVFAVYSGVLLLFRFVVYRVVSGAGRPASKPRGAGLFTACCMCCINCTEKCTACDSRGTLAGCANGVCPHRRSGVLFTDVMLCHKCSRKIVQCCEVDCDDCLCFCFECRFRKDKPLLKSDD